MSTIESTDLAVAVEDAAAHLYVWALKDIPQDLRDALRDAMGRETHRVGKRILETINTNVSVADEQGNLVCPRPGSRRRCARAPGGRRSSIRCARTPSTR
jgi:tartrate dehydratase alpha subunit/fumarate hydratase class I-like protein